MKVDQNSGNVVVYLKEECDTDAVELGILLGNIVKAYIKRAF